MKDEEKESNKAEDPPEIKVVKGLPIWLEDFNESKLLARICILPDAWSVLTQLARGTLHKSEIAYLTEEKANQPSIADITKSWEDLIYRSEPSGTVSESGDSVSKLDQGSGLIHLFAAMSLLADIWGKDDRKLDLRAVITIPETMGGEAEILAEDAAFVMRPGSLEALVGAKGTYVATKWLIAAWLRRGRVPSQIADDIVLGLRKKKSGDGTLQTTREAEPNQVIERPGVIIFIHGLMSIDAGLFDNLVTAIQADSDLKNYTLLAFPHDTLASINTNAQLLIPDIDYLFEGNLITPLVFVCHSRGGLLARKVAAELYKYEPERWKEQLAGCVTFGTPHQGTPLAENASALLAAGVTAIRWIQPGGFLGLADVLALVSAHGGDIPGVDDMKPITAVSKDPHRTVFLGELQDAERGLAKQQECRLKILAIGGHGPHNTGLAYFTERKFRGVPNDCAVELRSSAPVHVIGVTRQENSTDHFSYFSKKVAFREALDFIKDRVRTFDPVRLQRMKKLSKADHKKLTERVAAAATGAKVEAD